MKRSHSSSEDEIEPIKKTKNESSNESYYVIRKSNKSVPNISILDFDKSKQFESKSSSFQRKSSPFKRKPPSFDSKSFFDTKLSSKRHSSSLFDKRDSYSDKDERNKFDRKSSSSLNDRKDRYEPFNKRDRQDSLKAKSTSSLNDSIKIDYSGYEIRLPSYFKTDSSKDKGECCSSNNDYIIKRSYNKNIDSLEMKSTNESFEFRNLKQQFEHLIKNKNLDYKLEWSVGLTLSDDKKFVAKSHKSPIIAEMEALSMAIEDLKSSKSIILDDTMVEDTQQNVLNEIKEFLRKEDLLFIDEIPTYYQRKFKRKIADDWFDKVKNDSSFHVERHGSGNLVSIKLLRDH